MDKSQWEKLYDKLAPDGVIDARDLMAMPLPDPLVTKGNGRIVIKNPPYADYEFEASRCDTPQKLLGWIFHLCEKRWVTTRHIEDLIRATGFIFHGV